MGPITTLEIFWVLSIYVPCWPDMIQHNPLSNFWGSSRTIDIPSWPVICFPIHQILSQEIFSQILCAALYTQEPIRSQSLPRTSSGAVLGSSEARPDPTEALLGFMTCKHTCSQASGSAHWHIWEKADWVALRWGGGG